MGVQAISTSRGTMLKTFLHVSSQKSLKNSYLVSSQLKWLGLKLYLLFNVAGCIFREVSLPFSLFVYFQLGSRLERELCFAKITFFLLEWARFKTPCITQEVKIMSFPFRGGGGGGGRIRRMCLVNFGAGADY